MRLYAALLLSLASVAAAEAATLTVSPQGSDASNCLSAPCKTLQRAADLAAPGDTVRIRDGVYTGFSVTRSGVPGKPITFIAESRCKAQLTSNVKVHGKSHVILRGLNVRAVSGNISGNAFDVVGVGSDIAVEESCAYSPTGSCFAAWGTPWQQDPAAQGYKGLRNITVRGNTFLKCNNGGANEGITIANGVDGVLIQSNEVGDTPGDIADGRHGGEGIDLKAGVKNARILSNWVHNRPHLCIYVDGGGALGHYESAPDNRNIEIAYNRVTDCGDTAIQVSTEAAGNVSFVHVHDNTIERTKDGFGILVYRHPSAAEWAKPLPPGCVRTVSIERNRIIGAARGATKQDSACSTGIVWTNNGAGVTPQLPPATQPDPWPPAPGPEPASLDVDSLKAAPPRSKRTSPLSSNVSRP